MFESSGELKPMDLNDLEHDLEDDQYQLLAERIGPKKKGRPAHLPSLVVNNRLLLQLNMLKNRGRIWAEVQSLFSDICRHQKEPVPTCNVEPLIRTCLPTVFPNSITACRNFPQY